MKKTLTFLIIVVLFAAACQTNNTPKASNDEEKMEAAINPDNLVVYELEITGMTCTGCENTIQEGVSKITGVKSIEASHNNANAMVSFDSELTNIKEISELIGTKGYQVVGTKEISSDDQNSDKETTAK